MEAGEDQLRFIDDTEEGADESLSMPCWRVLVVDDDEDVHESTRFALNNIAVLHRPLRLLHARSGHEALAVLHREPDIAVILLDVVMESDDAGLRTVEAIRNEMRLASTRIILRTGQPGRAPEAETIARYDINDYKTKSELTQSKLLTALTTAIRSYDQLQRLEANRRGLEKIVDASNQFIAEQGLHSFADGVITQIAGLLGVKPEGLVCAASDGPDGPDGATGAREFRVIAAAGRFSHLIQRRLDDIADPRIVRQLHQSLETRRSIMSDASITLYFRKTAEDGFATFIDSARAIDEIDQDLLSVFCTNIALCAKNIDLVSDLRREAFVDRQLAMPNRTALVCELNRRLGSGEADGEALAVLDVDQFAAVNDSFGHDYGDALLRQTAHRLREFFEGAYVARLAGDAFGIIAPSLALTPEHLRNCFVSPLLIDGVTQQSITLGVGIVPLAGLKRSGIEFLKDGYLALKRAKSQGLGQVVMFTPEFGSETRARAALLRDLKLALDHEQLFLTYQPQIDLRSGRVVGAEALLRWRKEDGSLVMPDRFIPVAEQSGLIVGIGGWLLQTALLTLQRCRAAGHGLERIAVNISPIQLLQHDFVDVVAEALQQTGSSPADLELEVTESVAVGGINLAVQQLEQLRRTGCTVAIDDFGTGYSSLAYLDRLPVDRLKIDRGFVSTLIEEGSRSRIARTIVVLGRELGLSVIAEGVENAAMRDRILQLGCDEAQGYLYAKPLAEDEFLSWLAKFEETRQ